MTAVVVQAHPLDESYSAALLDAAVSGLRRAGPTPHVVRLNHGDVLDAEVLESANQLVCIYPTWWGGVPAMLLGPLTDLLVDWVDGAAPQSTSPLRTIARLTVVTTYGGSKAINFLQGEAAHHFWKRTVTQMCAPGSEYARLALYDVVNADEQRLGDFLDRVESELSASA